MQTLDTEVVSNQYTEPTARQYNFEHFSTENVHIFRDHLISIQDHEFI